MSRPIRSNSGGPSRVLLALVTSWHIVHFTARPLPSSRLAAEISAFQSGPAGTGGGTGSAGAAGAADAAAAPGAGAAAGWASAPGGGASPEGGVPSPAGAPSAT